MCLESATNLLIWYSEEMIGIYLSVKKRLRIDEKGLGLVLGYDSVCF